MTSRSMRVKSATVVREGPRTYNLEHTVSSEEKVSPEELFRALDEWLSPLPLNHFIREFDQATAAVLGPPSRDDGGHPNYDDVVRVDRTYWARTLRWHSKELRAHYDTGDRPQLLEAAIYAGHAYARLCDYAPLPDQSSSVATYADRGFQQTQKSSQGGKTSARQRTAWKTRALAFARARRLEEAEITQEALAFDVRDDLLLSGQDRGLRSISQLLSDAVKAGDLPPRSKKSDKKSRK